MVVPLSAIPPSRCKILSNHTLLRSLISPSNWSLDVYSSLVLYNGWSRWVLRYQQPVSSKRAKRVSGVEDVGERWHVYSVGLTRRSRRRHEGCGWFDQESCHRLRPRTKGAQTRLLPSELPLHYRSRLQMLRGYGSSGTHVRWCSQASPLQDSNLNSTPT